MRCPFCGDLHTQVKDSRPSEDGSSIRRRRSCPACGGRFTTFERIQLRELIVIKSDGKKELFDRDKLTRSMQIALSKRPVDIDTIDLSINGIVRQLESLGDGEITTKKIGNYVMNALKAIDVIGYIRYASVYRDFREADDFNDFLETVQSIGEEMEKKSA